MTDSISGPLTPEAGREGPGTPSGPPRRSGPGAWIAGGALLAVVAAGAWFARSLQAPQEPAAPDTAHAHAAPHDSAGTPFAATDSVVNVADLPGFDTAGLTDAQRLWLYHQAHLEKCGCGCGMNIAQCRVEDLTCPESPGRARELVEEAKKRRPAG